MAELSLRERLQPTLLDRLVDEERLLTVFELIVGLEDLRRLGLSVRELLAFVVAQGLTARGEPRPVPGAAGSASDRVCLHFTAPEGRVSAAQFRALVLKAREAPQGAELRSFC